VSDGKNHLEYITVTCFEGGEEFTFAWTDEYEFDPNEDRIACIRCAKKLGDDTMYACLNCGVQFQALKRHPIFAPESCSDECGNAIDLAVDRAQERDLAREQARLEAM